MKLFEQLAQGTGLPENLITNELNGIASQIGKSNDEVSLEDLRRMMEIYLQDVFMGLKDSE